MPWNANSILELQVGYLVNAQRCLLVTHWKGGDTGSGKTELEICEGIVAAQSLGGNGTLTGELQNILASTALINFVSAQAVFPTRIRRTKAVCALPGLRVGLAQAQNVQASMQKATQLAGRSQIGGMRIGAIPVADLNAGLLTAAYMTAFNTFANWYLNSSQSLEPDGNVTWYPVILNKEVIPGSNPPKLRIKGASSVAVVTTYNTIRTLSRRTIGRGE